MYRFQPNHYSPSNCRPVVTLRAAVMEPCTKMACLKDLVGFDPLLSSQDGQDISVCQQLHATLEPLNLDAWQLTNGVHLALSYLVTSKLINISEATTIHALFLHKT